MAEGMIITYETLFDLLRREKSRDELQELDEDFYKNVAEYLQEKNKLLESSGEGFMDEAEKTRIQISNIKKIIKELYERRERKIINLALFKSRLNNKILDTRALLPEEKLLFDYVVKQLDENRNAVLNSIIMLKTPQTVQKIVTPEPLNQKNQPAVQAEPAMPEPKPESNPKPVLTPETATPTPSETESQTETTQEEDDETKMIRFTNPVPKFLGTELEIYGPYEEEDVANLPSKIADVLIQKGRAEEIAK